MARNVDMFPVDFTSSILREKGKREKKGKKTGSHVNATITNGVTITADEMTSYPQQIPSICKLKFKISSADEETLRLISKGKGKNNRSVLLEQRRPDIRVSQRNDRDAV